MTAHAASTSTPAQRLLLARQQLQNDQLKAAAGTLAELMALSPPPIEAFELQVSLCQRLGDRTGLDTLAATVRQLDPHALPEPAQLGHLLLRLGLSDEAIRAFQTALERTPDDAQLWMHLGRATLSQGDIDNTQEAFSRAHALAPEDLRLQVAHQLLLPVLYRTPMEIDAWRRRFRFGLEALEQELATTPQRTQPLYPILTGRTNFFLGFQARDDRELQARYGRLLQAVVSQHISPLPSQPRRAGRIRVAYLSSYFTGHTVGRLAEGLITHHDRERFELFVYHLGETCDAITERLRQNADHFEHLGPTIASGALADARALASHVRNARPDIAAFPDLGMEPLTMTLAAARLAPVQCTFWYHPITSGIPNVDYFVSSEAMEPANAAQHYTEKLVTLPGIASCYPRPGLPAKIPSRSGFGLPDDAVIYLSPQFLYKYLPQYDGLFPRIARQVPKAKFVFLAHHSSPHLTRRLLLRLANAFAREGLNFADWCVILPQQSGEQYLQLNRVSDVLLDTVGWSGGRTTLEGIACGLPVVTLPGEFMRGRHTFAMLSLMGLQSLIAQNEAEYVQLAVRLGLEPAWRAEVLAQQAALADRVVFDRRDVVTALEAAMEGWVAREA